MLLWEVTMYYLVIIFAQDLQYRVTSYIGYQALLVSVLSLSPGGVEVLETTI